MPCQFHSQLQDVSEIFAIADQLTTASEFPGVLATLVKVDGSSYRRVGARRLHRNGRSAVGTISGGCLERDIDAHAQALIDSVKSYELISYDTTSENDLLWGAGTGCHGVVHILLEKLTHCPPWAHSVKAVKIHRCPVSLCTAWGEPEPTHPVVGTGLESPAWGNAETTFKQTITPPRQLVIFGAGDDAIPLHGLATQLGWETKIFDPRPAFATRERFPEAISVSCAPAELAATQVDWDDHTFAVIMTHHYRFDLPLLKTLLPLQLSYLGLLGPRERGRRLLHDAGFTDADKLLHSPVGLDLGGDTAANVALSIVSEIQAHLEGRTPQPLRERHRPIHER